MHALPLPDPVRSIGRLVLDGRIPPTVNVHHVIGGRQVQAGAAGLEGGDQDRRTNPGVAVLESVDEPVTVAACQATVQQRDLGAQQLGEPRREQFAERGELGEHQGLIALGDQRRRDVVEQFEFPRPVDAPPDQRCAVGQIVRG